MDQPKKKNIWKKVGRIVLKTIAWIFLFLVLIVLLILTPPVQNFIKGKAVSYLENKLHTKVAIGKIFIGLPKKVVLEGIYVEDQKKDTLLYGGSIKVDVGLFDIIFNSELTVNSLQIKNITAKVSRQLPDTLFNFQFIIDAFAPKEPTVKDPADTSSSGMAINIKKVELDNIRIVYKDVVSGNDAALWLGHFDTKVDKFDLDHMTFDVPRTNLHGFTAKIYQSKPLSTPDPVSKDMAEAKEPINLNLRFKEVDLKDINVDFKNDVSAMYAMVNLGVLNVKPEQLDLTNRVVALNDVTLSNTIANIHLGKKEQAKIVENEVEQEAASQAEAGWKIAVNNIDFSDNNIQFDNDNTPRLAKGMDFAHLKIDSLTLKAKNFIMANDSIGAVITQGNFSEQSGFVLERFETNFLYASNQSYLKDLYIKTPGTEVKRNLILQYDSIGALKKDIGGLKLDLDLDHTHILVKDILTFVPALAAQPAFADPNATWLFNSRITGSVRDMQIGTLQIAGMQDTRVDVSGSIAGLPDMKQLNANLVIRNLSSSRRDIVRFVPASSMPKNITIPSRLAINGKVAGNTRNMAAVLNLNTDLGSAAVNAKLRGFDNPKSMGYDASLQTRSLDLGTIMQNDTLYGPVTALIKVKGRGTDPKTANATFEGNVQSAVYKRYVYKDFKIKGNIANQQANLDAGIADPNIHFALNATANFADKYPAVKLTAMIDSIKAQALHLTPDVMIYRGKIEADFPVTNPDDLEGNLLVSQSLIVNKEQRLQLDTLQLTAGKNDSIGRYASLRSNIINAQLQGEYKLTEIGDVIQQAIRPYFTTSDSAMKKLAPYDFTLSAFVVDNPALRAMVPSLQRMDSLTIYGRFSDSAGINALVRAPSVDVGTNQIRNLQLTATTTDTAINVRATIEQVKSGTSVEINNTTFNAALANNNIDFDLNIKDKGLKDKYNLSGRVAQPQAGDLAISFARDSLLLNYDKWTIAEDNRILIAKNGINAKDFVLGKNGQELSIKSLTDGNEAPIEVNFANFKIATLTGFVQSDSTLVNGTLNGKATFNNITNEPVFVGDLTINDLSLKTDTVGNVKILVDNKVKDTYAADVTVSGRGNDINLAGNYYLKQAESNFDFDLNIREMPMKTAEAFSGGALKNTAGSLNGKFDITGTVAKPNVNGALNFNKTRFNPTMLNSDFSIDNEKMIVNNEGIRFDQFEIKDSSQNSLILDGLIGTENFKNYNLDLGVKARNFRALNSTKKDNKLFYGKLYFDTDLNIRGTETSPSVDGRFKINEKTSMSFVLPQREPGVVDREGIVEFVDMDAPFIDSLFMASYDSMNKSSITGMDISVNLEIDKAASFNLIIDEGNGDFLNVQGEATLNAGISPTGEVSLTGSYELEQGSYDLTLSLIKRKFAIEKGSRIVWEGAPTAANVDITAKYIASTAPLDLVKSQLDENISAQTRNTYLQKLPFEVFLKMQGKLLQPTITFDIQLPENKNYGVSGDILTSVRTRLDQVRQEPAEMDKQVFALLLLNRFVAENPFSSSSGGGSAAATLVRQSASKLLTEQLNKLADDLITGVDLNFDVASAEDYSSGTRRDRTDLNVGLSKRLLNDRLTVSIGSNFELEGPQSSQQSNNLAGNVALDYRLSRDNRYLLRAYRKNEYQGVIDGYVIETGVGFIITVDYNRFKDIFMSKKAREEQRQRREAIQESNKKIQQEQQEKERQQRSATKAPVTN